MAELKTRPNKGSVEDFLESIENIDIRKDCLAILGMMKDLSGDEPQMWGNGIVGFGTYHYVYDSGREGDWFKIGFSPRKNNITLYLLAGFIGYDNLLARLGTYKTGKSCLYIKNLKDVDTGILIELISKSYKEISERYK